MAVIHLHHRDTHVVATTLFVISVLFLAIGSVNCKDCLGRDQCSCQYSDDNSVVDLSSIGNTDLTPKFKDVSSPDGNTYSFNPCYPFSEDDGNTDANECSNAAACLKDTTQTLSLIGTAQSAQFKYEDGTLAVAYTAGSGILTATEVTLVCDLHACTPSLEADGQQGPATYQMTLTTVCACRNGCDSSGPVNCKPQSSGSSGLGGGAIFLIIFFALILVYLIGGTVFMKFGMKAQGLEVIPNIRFWRSVPSSIKAGFMFALRPCLKKITGKSYDNI